MSRYKSGVIYKIVSNNPEITDCYVGSCCNFSKRKSQHKSNCNNENGKSYNFRVYQTIRENGGWENWSMLEIEAYPCETKRQLELKERHWLEQLKANLNCHIPSRTQKEYVEEHKDKILKRQKEYREENKDKMNEYYEKNRDKINEKLKQYREKNRDKINEKAKKLIECECGSVSRKSDISKHIKTKKHKYFEKLNEFIYS